MSGSTLFRAIAALVLIGLVALIGVNVYEAGMAQGMADAARTAVASGQPAPVVYYPGPHWGYGGFGFFWPILWIVGLFLLFGLLRGGRGKWGGHHDRLEDWHRRAHQDASDRPA
ncbi:MAG: hypothetical protein M3R49_00765 [Chloroflexota bacterium]|nr:hypothetical protein [Chloroflexota bacterium]